MLCSRIRSRTIQTWFPWHQVRLSGYSRTQKGYKCNFPTLRRQFVCLIVTLNESLPFFFSSSPVRDPFHYLPSLVPSLLVPLEMPLQIYVCRQKKATRLLPNYHPQHLLLRQENPCLNLMWFLSRLYPYWFWFSSHCCIERTHRYFLSHCPICFLWLFIFFLTCVYYFCFLLTCS